MGDKLFEKERIEKAAAQGETLLPPDIADKRLNALMLNMSLSLAEIQWSTQFVTFVDQNRGRFHDEYQTFQHWYERKGHRFDEEASRLDPALQERIDNNFEKYHFLAVYNSLNAVRKAGVARLQDVEYLEKGFEAWKAPAGKLKAAWWKIKALRREIAAKERELVKLEKKYTDLLAADPEQAEAYNKNVVEPALRKAEDEEGKLNESMDAEYETMFEIGFYTRVFHEAAGKGDSSGGESDGADTDEGP
ncbi:MAG: hypothetical protein FD180_1510 [Planctomycetota bacterium]|nr:MAG: hypothetical protein FD180_1510 [Planctomycetota bacterium]